MITTTVIVHVKDEHIKDFIEATRINHEYSIRENGNIRFDVLQDESDPSKFILYEAYETEETATAHKKTPHYLKWRETVETWMEEPRKGIRYKILFPEKG